MQLLLTFILIQSCFFGCKSRSLNGDSKTKFDVLNGPGDTPKLMKGIIKDTLEFCISGSYFQKDELIKFEPMIEKAVFAWIYALKDISEVPLAKKVNFSYENNCSNTPDNFDSSINFWKGDLNARSYHGNGLTTFNVNGPGKFNVMLHEMGHAFGLADTYLEGQSFTCQVGQPVSVMCSCYLSKLTIDDFVGVRTLFSLHNEDLLKEKYKAPFKKLKISNVNKWIQKSDAEINLLKELEDKNKAIGELNVKIDNFDQDHFPEAFKKRNASLLETNIALTNYSEFSGSLSRKVTPLEVRINSLRSSLDLSTQEIAKKLKISEEVATDPKKIVSSEEWAEENRLESIYQQKLAVSEQYQKDLDELTSRDKIKLKAEIEVMQKTISELYEKLDIFAKKRNKLYNSWIEVARNIFLPED